MSKVVVYSCVTGKYDKVLASILASSTIPEPEVSYVLFTDQLVGAQGKVKWEIKEPQWRHPICRRRTARWHKINSHVLFPDAEYTIWFDGSQRLKAVKPYEQLIQPHLISNDVATFKHPVRTCVFQELQACIRLQKDNKTLMMRQIDDYRKQGYPVFNGMVETACLARRHSPEVVQFNKRWWDQIQTYSYRDQLSFNYTAWKLKLNYSHVPGHRSNSMYCDFVRHGQG